jgi:hypothetical protein
MSVELFFNKRRNNIAYIKAQSGGGGCKLSAEEIVKGGDGTKKGLITLSVFNDSSFDICIYV